MFESALIGARQRFLRYFSLDHGLAELTCTAAHWFALAPVPCLTGSLQQVLVQLEVFLQHLIDLPGVHLGVQLGRCLR